MAIIKCKMCGGDVHLAEDKTFGTCEYCGSTMTFPRVTDEQRAAAFNRGNHFRRIGEFDKALAVYERIVAEDDTDAEAHWCCALCRFGIEYVEDPATYEWLPTCHRASFDSFLEDVDYLAAVEHSEGITRRQYQKDAAKIAEVQRGILATSQNAEPYDVFISYKELDEQGERTRDSILAQEIYYRLTEKGWRVFFSRISLEDVPGTQYEPYIFAALNSAKVMVVVGTSAENLNAVWVKNEWSRFLSLMRKDRSKLLIPCYRDMDPYDLPEQLAVLMSYDMGKIGFIQDLIRGVDKVLTADKPQEAPAPVQERVIVQQSGGGPNVTALLKRGQQALEDGDWDKARDFYDQVLSMDAENAEAFLGLALAEGESRDTQEYVDKLCSGSPKNDTIILDRDKDHINNSISSLHVPGYCTSTELLKIYDFTVNYTIRLRWQNGFTTQVMSRFESDRNLKRAFYYAHGETRVKLDDMKKALSERLDQQAREAEAADGQALEEAKAKYDAKMREADFKAQELNRKALAKRKEVEEAEVKAARKRKKTISVVSVLLFSTITFICLLKTVLIPDHYYRQAIGLADLGLYEDAIAVFSALGEYKDSADRIPILMYAQAEALLDAGNTTRAALVFGSLGDYQDSRVRSRELWDQVAQRHTVAAGRLHTVCLFDDNTVVAVGLNDAGQCDISDWSDIVAIAAGRDHSVGLRADGSVVAAGANGSGQCDISEWTDIVAISTGFYYTVGLRTDGTVVIAGATSSGRSSVSEWSDIVAVAAGSSHIVGLRADGSVVAVGYNKYGQCNVSSWSDIVAVSAGDCHTVGLRSDGSVVAVGWNEHGQCEVSGWSNIDAIAVGGYHTVGLRSDGSVVTVGANGQGQCLVTEWTEIVAIAAGSFHTLGLRSDGTVVAVGDNSDGQCDVSIWTDIKIPNK